MYYQVVRQFHKTLGNLDAILSKAEAHAVAKKFSPDNYLALRLAPDMLPFLVQIRIACDTAKAAAAAFAGQSAPKHEDVEATFGDLHNRIKLCRDYIDTLKESDFAAMTATTIVPIPYPPGAKMQAQEALISRAIPNFYFHVTTAYDLLRTSGVEIGKSDYLGQLNIIQPQATPIAN